jgi:hypothetical protein
MTGGPPVSDQPIPAAPRAWRAIARLIIGALLTLSTFLLLISLSTMQLTQRGPAERVLRQALLIVTEADALLDLHYDELRASADAGESAQLRLTNYPLDVTFTADEVRTMTREQFRDALLDRSAALVYEGGAAALRAEPTSPEPAVFSTPGAVRVGLDALNRDTFEVLRVITFTLGALSAILAVALALVTRGYGRLAAIGLSTALAAIPFMLAAVAVRYGLRVGEDAEEEYLVRAFLKLGAEVSWIAIRNGIAFSVLTAGFLLAGLGLAMWSDARGAALAPSTRPT